MKIWKHLATVINEIICDEIIGVKETNFNEKNIICKTQTFYILLDFLIITIVLLIAVSIYCDLLPFHNTNNKLNKFYIDSINWQSVT